MWRNFHKASSSEEKSGIKDRIDLVTDEINTLYGQRNACNRIIATYDMVYEEVKREFEIKENLNKFNTNNKNKNLEYS